MNTTTSESMRISENNLNHKFREQLREVGLNSIDMLRGETFNLASILLSDEDIVAGVFGRSKDGGSVLFLITNLRIISISQIPLFTDTDEFALSAVNGVSLDSSRFGSTIEIYTSIGNYSIHTHNKEAADRFVEFLEHTAIENLESEKINKV